MSMSKHEMERALIELRLSGMAATLETRILQAHATAQADILKHDEKCDLVICLSHLGYKYDHAKVSDIQLAQNSKSIDIIIGGHTHTFMDKPDIYRNKEGENVIIHQVGWAGIRLGNRQ